MSESKNQVLLTIVKHRNICYLDTSSQSMLRKSQGMGDIRFRMLDRKEEGREQTKFSRNEDVENT